MTFTPASIPSLIAFVIIVIAVLGAVIAATHLSSKHHPTVANVGIVSGLIALWLIIFSAIVYSGFAQAQPMPRLMILLGLSNLLGVVFALSPVGKQIAATLPLAALVGFQAFRLPLELVLHSWGEQGTIPMTMTWEGSNFDIISGVLALICAPLANKHKTAAWIFNIIGFALLMNVARVAILSSPLPFAWQAEPPLQLGFYLPYAWIVPVCVAGALAGHIVLTRALLSRHRS